MFSLRPTRLLGLVLETKPLTDLLSSSSTLPSRTITIADVALTCRSLSHITALPSTPTADLALTCRSYITALPSTPTPDLALTCRSLSHITALPSTPTADLALTCSSHITGLPFTHTPDCAHSLSPAMSCMSHHSRFTTRQLLTSPLPRATRQALPSLHPSPYPSSPLSPLLPMLSVPVIRNLPSRTSRSFTGTTSRSFTGTTSRSFTSTTSRSFTGTTSRSLIGTTSSHHPTSIHPFNLHPSPHPSLPSITQDWASIHRYNSHPPAPPPGPFCRRHTATAATSTSHSPGGHSSIPIPTSSSSSSSSSAHPLAPLSLTTLRCSCCGPLFDVVKLRPSSSTFTAAASSGRTGETGTVTVDDELASRDAELASRDTELAGRERRRTGTSRGSEGGAQGLQFYNTRTRRKEPFQPREPMKVNMYVCGVTAYDFSHIGHARVYVAFDVLFRYLLHMGYDVKYVRNFTDVDDKIIARAAEMGENPVALSARFCEEFRVDMEALRCLPPSVEPKVSEHIPHIIALIEQIIDNNHGYAVEGGDVFFSVADFPDYGALSGRVLEENRAGERVALDPRKRNPADFALWKSAKPGEISWASPWGPGRPGWHIECSAMSAAHLGPELDIHGGGADLVFPHHENELAQSRAADRGAGVRLWMHNGFVTVDAEKMSKSLGNFFTIREALQSYHPLALRYFLLSTQYRSPVNYSRRQLDIASDRVYYVFQSLVEVQAVLEKATAEAPSSQTQTQEQLLGAGAGKPKSSRGVSPSPESPSPETVACAESFRRGFEEAMADDLSTSHAIALLSEPFRIMNEFLSTKKGRKDKSRIASLALLKSAVEEKLAVLGLSEDDPAGLLEELKDKGLARAGLTREGLAAAVAERLEARQAKDYQRSDEIRAELARKGILLMDGGDAMLWRPGVVEEGA